MKIPDWTGVLTQIRNIFRSPIVRERKPRIYLAETGVVARVPLHGRSAAIPAYAESGDVALERVAYAITGNFNLTHSQFITIVDRGRAPQGQQQHGRDSRLAFANPARNPRPIVIAKHPVWPAALRQGAFIFGNQGLDTPRVPANAKERKIEGQVHSTKIPSIIGDQALCRKVDLPDQQPFR